MPFKSEAQRRFFNANRGKKGLSGKVVDEFNAASKGKDLPERVGDKPDKPPMRFGGKRAAPFGKRHKRPVSYPMPKGAK